MEQSLRSFAYAPTVGSTNILFVSEGYSYPAFILGYILYTIRHYLAQFLILKIMYLHLLEETSLGAILLHCF